MSSTLFAATALLALFGWGWVYEVADWVGTPPYESEVARIGAFLEPYDVDIVPASASFTPEALKPE